MVKGCSVSTSNESVSFVSFAVIFYSTATETHTHSHPYFILSRTSYGNIMTYRSQSILRKWAVSYAYPFFIPLLSLFKKQPILPWLWAYFIIDQGDKNTIMMKHLDFGLLHCMIAYLRAISHPNSRSISRSYGWRRRPAVLLYRWSEIG